MEQRKAWYPNGFNLPPIPELPAGVGVPGKPLTLDQFFTEDVFRMLVPDDGLKPTTRRKEDAPQLVAVEGNARSMEDMAADHDKGMVRLPDPHPDAKMAVRPDSLLGPSSCNYDAALVGRVQAVESAIAEHRDNITQLETETDPRKRAIADENRRINEKIIADSWAQYQRDRAILNKCSI